MGCRLPHRNHDHRRKDQHQANVLICLPYVCLPVCSVAKTVLARGALIENTKLLFDPGITTPLSNRSYTPSPWSI